MVLEVDDPCFGNRAENPVDRHSEVGCSAQRPLEAPDDIPSRTWADSGLSWVRHSSSPSIQGVNESNELVLRTNVVETQSAHRTTDIASQTGLYRPDLCRRWLLSRGRNASPKLPVAWAAVISPTTSRMNWSSPASTGTGFSCRER